MGATITEIEDAILARLNDKLDLAANGLKIKRGAEGITKPALNVCIDAGDFERLTMKPTYKVKLTIYLDIVFKHLSGDEETQRKGVAPILWAALLALIGQTLELDIKPLAPKRFRNTTTEELRGAGMIAFTLEMETTTTIDFVSDEEVVDLLSVGLSYFLQDPADDEIEDATDVVTLET